MADLNFPQNPAVGQTYVVGSKTYVWTGTSWTGASVGYQGSVGYTGSQGTTGYVGSQGIGFTGSQGALGFTGSIGFTGSQGLIGYTGSQGAQGVIGPQGTTGYVGSQGSLGYTGSQGFLGYTGSVGPQGTTGYVGSQGIQGTTGYTGSKGDTGAQGTAGYVGSQGIQGTTGYTGSKGDTGMGFTIAKSYVSVAALQADLTPTGIVGGQFAVVETGNPNDAENSRLYLWTGSTYTYVSDLSGSQGITGPQGNIGYTGSQGVVGYVGSQGGTGPIGVKGDTGLTGYTGSQGSLGYTGYVGSQGVVGFTGSQGVVGFTGSQGVVGSQGTAGYVGSQGIQGVAGYTGSAANMTVSTILGTDLGTIANTYANVNTLRFDTDAGFDLASLGDGTIKVGMNSTFKYITVDGQPMLTAVGLDTLRLIAGNNIALATDNAASPQSITISSTGANVVTQATPPATASAGDLWWNSEVGDLKVFYVDSDSSQWVDASSGPMGPTGYTGSAGTTTTSTTNFTSFTNLPYDLFNSHYGLPGSSEVVMRFILVRAITIPANFAGAICRVGIAPTNQYVYKITKNGAQVGTITIAAGSTTGVFSTSPAITVAAGDIVRIVAPVAEDGSLSDTDLVILATLQ